jgi:hypothetical protein
MKLNKHIIFILMMTFILFNSVHTQNYKLDNYVLSNGGVAISNGKYKAAVTIGQSSIGNISNDLYESNIGFWYQYSITITDLKEKWMLEIPKQFELYQNFPNPFNPATKIRYSIAKEGLVTLKIYNVIGEEVVTLVKEERSAGVYEINFNAASLPSGVYFYQVKAGDFIQTKKMILLK